MDLSVGSPDGVARHRNLVCDGHPHLRRAAVVCRSTAAADDAQMSDSAPATHVCCIAPSTLISSEDRLFSWVRIGYSAGNSLDSRFVFRLGNSALRRSAKAAHLRFVWWLDEFCGVELCICDSMASRRSPPSKERPASNPVALFYG